jgi:hypothetical protein
MPRQLSRAIYERGISTQSGSEGACWRNLEEKDNLKTGRNVVDAVGCDSANVDSCFCRADLCALVSNYLSSCLARKYSSSSGGPDYRATVSIYKGYCNFTGPATTTGYTSAHHATKASSSTAHTDVHSNGLCSNMSLLFITLHLPNNMALKLPTCLPLSLPIFRRNYFKKILAVKEPSGYINEMSSLSAGRELTASTVPRRLREKKKKKKKICGRPKLQIRNF